LSHTALLADPNPSVPFALVTDASTSVMGAMLQQRVQNVWHPTHRLLQETQPGPAQIQCIRLELLAIYKAVNISTTCWKLQLVKMSTAHSFSFIKSLMIVPQICCSHQEHSYFHKPLVQLQNRTEHHMTHTKVQHL
jgi:hypothetical protein